MSSVTARPLLHLNISSTSDSGKPPVRLRIQDMNDCASFLFIMPSTRVSSPLVRSHLHRFLLGLTMTMYSEPLLNIFISI